MVSVIVPVYNCGKGIFFERLVKSILNQTYHDIELLLIDDGSTDNSFDICKSFATVDKRVKCFHKENGGAGSARNWGLDEASGDMIYFSDSDDYLYPDFLETMVREADGYDLLVAGYVQIHEGDAVENITRQEQVSRSVSAKTTGEVKAKMDDLHIGWLGTLWRCLFRKSIIDKFCLRFSIFPTGEDELFACGYLGHCSSIKSIDYQGYLYIRRAGSLGKTRKNIPEYEYIKVLDKCYMGIMTHFGIQATDSAKNYRSALREKLASRLCVFLMKGYHSETMATYGVRMERWKHVRKMRLLCNPEKKSEHLSYAIILWICKHRLYRFFDPLFLISTRCRDRHGA